MQFSLENLGKLSRRLTVRIPAATVDDRVRDRLAELRRTVRLKGFRPGKIPPNVIEQRFGAQVRDETMSDVLGKSFDEAVNKEQVRPALPPQLHAAPARKDGEIEFSVDFEVFPDLGKLDVSTLALNRVTASVSESDIDRMIETLRQQRRTWTPADRIAGAGDMVVFEFAATVGDFRYPNIGRERAGTVLGSEALFAEFEARLAGMKAGDDVQGEMFFPDGFRVEGLSGKTAMVEVRVVSVQESVLPALDDAFIASFGVQEGGMDRFRRDVRQNLDRELSNAVLLRNKGEVVSKLVAQHQGLDVPEGMVAGQARALAEQARNEYQRAGQDPATAPTAEALRGAAVERVRASLLLIEIARQNQVQVDQRRVSELLNTIAQTYEEPQKVVEMYLADRDLMRGLAERVREDQVIDWILSHAQVTDQPLSFDEAMRRPGAA